jgi:hypothetical protein
MDNGSNFPHILNASTTLLGFCFVVLTSLRINDFKEASTIDELTAIAIIVFMASSILSYLSMRNSRSLGRVYEKAADIVFLCGLFFLFATTMLITLDIVS